MKRPHKDVLTILALLSLKDDGYVYMNIYLLALSQSTFLLEALTATAFFPFSLLPQVQLSTLPPTYGL